MNATVGNNRTGQNVINIQVIIPKQFFVGQISIFVQIQKTQERV